MKRTHRDGIILIRNPYRAIYGYRHLNDGGHLGLADASKFFGPVWDGFVSAKIQQWEQFYIKWLEEGKNVSVIVYENLKTGKLRKSMKDISKFLNQKMDDH